MLMFSSWFNNFWGACTKQNTLKKNYQTRKKVSKVSALEFEEVQSLNIYVEKGLKLGSELWNPHAWFEINYMHILLYKC